MEALVIVLVACVVLLALAMLCVLVWREHQFIRQVDELTSKLASRTIGEYASARQVEKSEPQPKQDKQKKPSDPVLGANY